LASSFACVKPVDNVELRRILVQTVDVVLCLSLCDLLEVQETLSRDLIKIAFENLSTKEEEEEEEEEKRRGGRLT